MAGWRFHAAAALPPAACVARSTRRPRLLTDWPCVVHCRASRNIPTPSPPSISQHTRKQDEMLGSVKADGAADWSVLVMDATTTKVMSRAARVSDLLDYGVSRA